MKIKILGIVGSAAIVVVIALSLINFGNYHSLLPERPAKTEQCDSVELIDCAEQCDSIELNEVTEQVMNETNNEMTTSEQTTEEVAIDAIPELTTDKIRVVGVAPEATAEEVEE
ncbi:MAG: hypothetical protein II315_03910 [Rikenellaceae bacterium]|nr:hypothetical protein [Rikenellaceae bacterium]